MGAHGKQVAQSVLPAGAWELDPHRSEVAFEVRHLGISRVGGRFTEVRGALHCEQGTLRVLGSVASASVATGDRQRDGLLCSPGLFDAERHPRITFTCVCPAPGTGEPVEIDGALEIRGLSRPLRLASDWRLEPDATGAPARVFVRASAELRRSDYGLRFPGGAYGDGLVGQKVKIRIELYAARAASGS